MCGYFYSSKAGYPLFELCGYVFECYLVFFFSFHFILFGACMSALFLWPWDQVEETFHLTSHNDPADRSCQTFLLKWFADTKDLSFQFSSTSMRENHCYPLDFIVCAHCSPNMQRTIQKGIKHSLTETKRLFSHWEDFWSTVCKVIP